MFTREDYQSYFSQIAKFEKAMVLSSHEIAGLVDDKYIKSSVDNIFHDEVRHYAYAREVLDFLSNSEQIDRRQYKREYSLGDVLIDFGKPVPYSALCLDISEGGIKMESSRDFTKGQVLKLEIKLYEKKEIIRHSARVVWSTRIEGELFLVGLEFV